MSQLFWNQQLYKQLYQQPLYHMLWTWNNVLHIFTFVVQLMKQVPETSWNLWESDNVWQSYNFKVNSYIAYTM